MEISSFINVEINSGKSQQTTDGLVGNLNRIDESQEKVNASTKRGTKSYEEFGKGSEKASQSAKRSSDQIIESNRKTESSFYSLKNAIKAVAITFVSRELVGYTNQWTDLNSRLVNATGSHEKADIAMSRIADTARRTYSSLEQTSEAYIRNNMTLTELGYTMQKQLDLSDALNNSLVVSGVKGVQAEMVMDALAKSFAVGELGLANFNSVARESPRTIQALADGLGVGTIALREMAEDGLLTTSVVVRALTSQMEQLREEADAMPATVGDGLLLIRNAAMEVIGEVDEAVGASSSLAEKLVDISDLMRDSIPEIIQLGQEIKETIDIMSDGFDGFAGDVSALLKDLDDDFSTFFNNTSLGSISTSEIMALAFVPTLGAMRTGIQVLTVESASLFDKWQLWRKRDYMDEEEYSSQMQALEKARLDTILDFLNANTESNEALYERLNALRENREAFKELKDETEEGVVIFGELTDETYEAWLEMMYAKGVFEDTREVVEDVTKRVKDYIGELADEQQSLKLSGREQAMKNAELKALSMGAGPLAIKTIRELAGINYDLAESAKEAEKREKDLEKATRKMAEQMQEDFDEMSDSFGSFFADFVQDGEDAFQSLLNSFERMLLEMAGKLALSGIMELSGIKIPGLSSGNGLSSVAANSGIAGSIFSSVFSGGLSAIPGSSGFVGPLAAGTSTGLGAYLGGIGSALAASPLAIGAIALVAGKVLSDKFSGDGKTRENAGFFVAPTPGATSGTFDVDPFESGLRIQGFSRRADKSEAIDVINVFRDVDASVSKLTRALDGEIDLSRATLAGLNEEAIPGSSGTFLGKGGNGSLTGDLQYQINFYVKQLVDNISGLDESLMGAIKSASSAEEVINLLKKAVEDKEIADKDAKEAIKEAEKAVEKLRKEEERLLKYRLDSIGDLSSAIESAYKVNQNLLGDIFSIIGGSGYGDDFESQIRRIEDERASLISSYEKEARAMEQLKETYRSYSIEFGNFADSLKTSEFSNLSPEERYSFASSNFRELAAKAANGDLDAAKALQGAANSFLEESTSRFASGAQRKSDFQEVLDTFESLSLSYANKEFDPQQANDELLAKLADLNYQLSEISNGINEEIISELKNINVNLEELSSSMQSGLIDAISQWIENSSPEGEDIISSLSGIKGSIDLLPPEIANYMASSIGFLMAQLYNSGKSAEYIANQFVKDSLPANAADKFLSDNNLGKLSDYATSDQDIVDYVNSFETPTSNIDAIREIGLNAIEKGISSARLADLFGYTQEEVLAAAAAAGLPAFRTGGDHSGGYFMAGEDGPEIVATGRARIFNASETSSILNPSIDAETKSILARIEKILFVGEEYSGEQRSRIIDILEKISSQTSAKSSGLGSLSYE